MLDLGVVADLIFFVILGYLISLAASAARRANQEEVRLHQERVWEQEQQQRNQQEAKAQQAREKEQHEKERARRQQENQEDVRRQQEGENERKAKLNGTGTQDWWAVLGISQDATLETAKYRSKMKQYHPDRVEGLGPEFIQLASQKSKELNAALIDAKRYARA